MPSLRGTPTLVVASTPQNTQPLKVARYGFWRRRRSLQSLFWAFWVVSCSQFDNFFVGCFLEFHPGLPAVSALVTEHRFIFFIFFFEVSFHTCQGHAAVWAGGVGTLRAAVTMGRPGGVGIGGIFFKVIHW